MWTFKKYFHKHLDALKALIWAFSLNEVFPHACVKTRGKVKERKTGGWNHRKRQSESERTKENKLN